MAGARITVEFDDAGSPAPAGIDPAQHGKVVAHEDRSGFDVHVPTIPVMIVKMNPTRGMCAVRKYLKHIGRMDPTTASLATLAASTGSAPKSCGLGGTC